MRIDELHLENFKKFAVQDIDLHPHFTLLVGENGAGKTSVLDALAVAAGVWLAKPPDSTLVSSARNIHRSEVRLQPQPKGDRIQFQERRPVIIRAKGRIGEHENVQWTRQIRPVGIRTTNADAEGALGYVKDIYSRDGAGENVLCPVLAYYGAGRAWLPSNERVPRPRVDGPARRWAAFYDCFNERIRSAELHKWFSRETTERGNRAGKWRPGFEVVRRAVLRCVPDADGVWFDTDRNEIVLSIGGNAQPFDNLSAGQRMMLALIADLAIKAVTQNAYLLPPDELGPEDEPWPRVLNLTPGVVLIDELDVHLHPIWQRRIATDLKEAFPAIQFVCTSHSPQLIGELQPDEIRLMHADEFSQPSLSFGQDSNWVVEVLMGGSKCNSGVKARLAKIFQLIKISQLQEAETEAFGLRAEIGNNDELQRAVSLIERIKLLGNEMDHRNIVAALLVSGGGKKVAKSALFGASHRENDGVPILPTDQGCEARFTFDLAGGISSTIPGDPEAVETISVLNLGHETLTGWRAQAIATFIEGIETRADAERIVEKTKTPQNGWLPEYCFAIQQVIQRFLNSLP